MLKSGITLCISVALLLGINRIHQANSVATPVQQVRQLELHSSQDLHNPSLMISDKFDISGFKYNDKGERTGIYHAVNGSFEDAVKAVLEFRKEGYIVQGVNRRELND